jgi:hypothetical protein
MESNKSETKEIIHCDFQPIPFRIVGAVDPTVKAYPRFSNAGINHCQEDKEYPENKQTHSPSGCLVKFSTVTATLNLA